MTPVKRVLRGIVVQHEAKLSVARARLKLAKLRDKLARWKLRYFDLAQSEARYRELRDIAVSLLNADQMVLYREQQKMVEDTAQRRGWPMYAAAWHDIGFTVMPHDSRPDEYDEEYDMYRQKNA